MTELLYKYITYDIRGACFNVYKEFGGPCKEKVVERSLVIELEDRKRKVASQKRINIFDYVDNNLIDNPYINNAVFKSTGKKDNLRKNTFEYTREVNKSNKLN